MEYKYQIIYTSSYDVDFEKIATYFLIKFKNPNLIKKIDDEVKARESLLMAFPYAFPLFESNTFIRFEYRTFRVGNYKVFYRIDELSKAIYIQRILYNGMDLENMAL